MKKVKFAQILKKKEQRNEKSVIYYVIGNKNLLQTIKKQIVDDTKDYVTFKAEY